MEGRVGYTLPAILFLVMQNYTYKLKKLKYLLHSFIVSIFIAHQLFKMFAYTDHALLCTEIRSRNIHGTGAYHHWSIDIPDQVQMQSVFCAVCGNYQEVSTYDLQDALMETARHIMCEDPEHIRITLETIFLEEGGRRPAMDSDAVPEEDRTETDSMPGLEEDSESDTDSMPGLEEDDELGPPPLLPPLLIRTNGYDWRSDNLNDWTNARPPRRSRDNDNFLPRQ